LLAKYLSNENPAGKGFAVATTGAGAAAAAVTGSAVGGREEVEQEVNRTVKRRRDLVMQAIYGGCF
jgi:hypothetical protein